MAENERNMVAFCGLYCGDCRLREGAIARLAGELGTKLDGMDFARVGTGLATVLDAFRPLADYSRFREALASLEGLQCSGTCKEGGGTSFCGVRVCCREKGIEGCWQCGEYEQCETLGFLEPVNGDSHLRNLRKLRNEGMDAFLTGEKYW